MRILLLTSDLAGTGANYVRTTHLGRAMVEEGHAVTVLAGSPSLSLRSGRSIRAGVEIVYGIGLEPRRLRRSGLGMMELLGRSSVLRGREFDIVHAFGHRPSAWAPAALRIRRLGAPMVADWADWFGRGGIASERGWLGRATLGWLDTWLEASISSWAGAVTVVTSHLAKLAQEMGFPADRVLRITAGASVDTIRPLPKGEMRARLGLAHDLPIVLHAGLSARDLPTVMATFDEVARKHSQAHLLLVGAPSQASAEMASRCGWGNRLIQLPHTAHDELGEVLACGDVMLLPFPQKGMNLGRFPNQAGDYMAAGRPIVTNPTGDLGEFVRREKAGLVASEHPRQMAEAVVALLENLRLAEELGENGRRAAVEQLAWPLVTGKILAFYNRLPLSA